MKRTDEGEFHMEQLDKGLLALVGRRPQGGSRPRLTLGERVAANLFWREGVPLSVLMEVFQCGKNTLYGNCFTGGGAYVSGSRGVETNEIVDAMGVEAATRMYITEDMNRAVNAGMQRLAKHAA
jgi:hypothetical protein